MASHKKQRAGDLDEHARAQLKAIDEAVELLERMRVDIAAISDFLETETAAVERRRTSSKRLARLRLIAEDLTSATRFASKPVKG